MYETTLYIPILPGQPQTHHQMQVPMGNQHRVSPGSHLTTRSLCDFLFNRFVSFWAIELFGVSPRVSYTLRNFSGLHRWIRCLTRFSGFSPEGVSIPYLLRPTHFIFHFRLTLWKSIGLRPIPKPTRFNTKRSAKSVP